MAKGKSSASSATRKKHAKKAAGPIGDVPPVPKEKKPKGKGKKDKEPRKKVYIPPVKPAPIQPDPLDTLGIAHKLPPELQVVLRRLAKKDSTTKRRALEELQSAWLDKARNEGEFGAVHSVLPDVVPVWLHHIPLLFLHPSRRIRLLAVDLHMSFLHASVAVRDQIFFFVRDVASADQAKYLLGAWCLATYDVDRQIASRAHQSWDAFVSTSTNADQLHLDSHLITSIWNFVQEVIFDPTTIYLNINPPQPVAPTPLQKRGAARIIEPEPSARIRSEEDEEDEQDRAARLRVEAFGAAQWVLINTALTSDTFFEPFANPALWSALHIAQKSPFVAIESFGFNQPHVRRAAWALLQRLLTVGKGKLHAILPVLSTFVLRSAWIEQDKIVMAAMWQPLLMFLKEFPRAWELDAAADFESDDVEQGDSDDDDDDNEKPSDPIVAPSHGQRSHAYLEFLQFLQLGCSGAPLAGYPTVIVILSTLPSSIIASTPSSSPLSDLFTSFWAAIDGRAFSALDRNATGAAFLEALLECLLFMFRRLLHGSPEQSALLVSGAADSTIDPCASSQELARENFGRVWEELSTTRLRVDSTIAGKLLAKTLVSLHKLDQNIYQTAWDTLAQAIRNQMTSDTTLSDYVFAVPKVFLDTFEDGSVLAVAARGLVRDIVKAAIVQCGTMDTPSPLISSLANIFETFGSSIFGDAELAKSIDEMVHQHTDRMLHVSSALLIGYLLLRGDRELCLQLWRQILSVLASQPHGIVTSLSPFLDAAESNRLAEYLVPTGNELDDVSGILLTNALHGPATSPELQIIDRLLQTPDHFISPTCVHALVHSIGAAFSLHLEGALANDDASSQAFESPLALIRIVSSTALVAEFSVSVMPNIFLFAYLLPTIQDIDSQTIFLTRDIWTSWLSRSSAEARRNGISLVTQRLSEFIADCSTPLSARDIIEVLTDDNIGFILDIPKYVFPSRAALDAMLDDLPTMPVDASVAVIDALVPSDSTYRPGNVTDQRYDRTGLSPYARVVNAYLLHLANNRQSAKENLWMLRHCLALAQYVGDFIEIPSAGSPILSSQAPIDVLKQVLTTVQQLTTYLLATMPDAEWHSRVVSALLGEKVALDDIGQLVYDLIRHPDNIRESRILRVVLQHILGDATKSEAEHWIRLARKLEGSAPQASLAVLFSITQYAPEPPLLDRYRNELAANILGVRASKANTEALWLLRRLVVTAPDPDSEVIFLPQQRAVNLMKACEQWIASDEDLAEEVESELTAVFVHLAPILQNVPGSHWDLMFDVMENNLENSSFTESSTLVTMSRTLRLFLTVDELASRNKSLRAIWQERRMVDLTLVRDMVAVRLDVQKISTPLSVCRKLALSVIQDLPESLLDPDTLSRMCHLVTDSSVDVQKLAYHLLNRAAKKRTEYLTIEAGVDSEAVVKTELPIELVDILQRTIQDDDDTEFSSQNLFGYMIGWMLLFDLFEDASLKVKSGYIEHLKELDLIAVNFMPHILSILGLYDGIAKAFKLETWAVDEYYLDLYTPECAPSLPLLAAHLYYRALLLVPSIFRSWLLECRDRQLSVAVTTYTSNHFSPAIIATELQQVRDSESAITTADDAMKIRVASVVREITASYTVDEYQLELRLKLPADWPLHAIEIKDTKPVGVADERWRAWILGVQQIVTFRSGSIIDGISFFAKNVMSHFEGLTECAICYSVISATDGGLPTKPCRTCKNRFHAGCLYKWFNSSHSSSCPLCRSDIF